MKALAVARDTLARYNQEKANILAAALAYYTLLSIFPLILGLVAVSGFFIEDPAVRNRFIHGIAVQFPGSASLIETTLRQIIKGRSAAGVVATLGLIWSASGVFGALTLALDQIVGARQRRGFVASTVLAIALVFGVGVLFVASLLVTTVLRLAFETQLPIVGLSLGDIPLLYALVGLAFPLMITFLAFTFLYHFAPSQHMPWDRVWPGALLAAVAFEVAKQAFAFYLGLFTNFNAVYGSIGAVIALLTWAYYASIVILIGAAFNVVLQSSPPRPTAESSRSAR